MKILYTRRHEQAKNRGGGGGISSHVISTSFAVLGALLIAACPNPADDPVPEKLDFTITYPSKNIIALTGRELKGVTPTISPAGAKASFTITKGGELPAGLKLDSAAGTISGTPASEVPVGAKPYTVTATAGGKTASFDITIEVQTPLTAVSYPAGTLLSLTQDTALTSEQLTSLVPVLTPPRASASYSIDPDLTEKTGLAFSTDTGRITGTPTKAAFSRHRISAVGKSGYAGAVSTAITISVKGERVALNYPASGEALNLEINTVLTPEQEAGLTPVLTPGGASVENYSISPDITANTGLNFSTADGRITGTPTKPAAPVEYTVRAAGSGLYTGATVEPARITIGVVPAASSVTYSGSFIAPGAITATSFDFTGQDGSTEAKAYQLNFNKGSLPNGGRDIDLSPAFNPPEAGSGVTYALQKKNTAGIYMAETPASFNLATGGGESVEAFGLSFNPANGKITGQAGKLVNFEYKIVITLNADSIYSDGTTVKEVFFKLRIT